MKKTLPQVSAIHNLGFRCLLLFTCFLSYTAVNGSITIDSVVTQTSSCANNGSVTIYAQSNSNPILYGIISGPATRPLQSGSLIGGLAPGTYTVIAVNFDGDTASAMATVTGNYEFPNFTVSFTNPLCPNSGVIIGTPDAGTGDKPYTWELTNTSTGKVTTQASDTFTGLGAGTYSLRMYDSCQSYTTEGVTLQSTYSPLTFFDIENIFGGCDTVAIRGLFLISQGFLPANPVTVDIEIGGNNYQKTVNLYQIGGGYGFYDTIAGINYGATGTMTVTDVCGNTISHTDTILPFAILHGGFTTVSHSCQVEYIPQFGLNGTFVNATFANQNLSYVGIDSATGLVADSGVVNFYADGEVNPLPANTTYIFTFKDPCGHSSTVKFTTPAISPISVYASFQYGHCVDSSASCQIDCSNFTSVTNLRFLSGPVSLHSTKPFFAYNAPIDFYNQNFQPGPGGVYSFTNLAAGTYVFVVSDSCGHTVTDSVTILPSDLGADELSILTPAACPGQNEIIVSMSSNLPINTITDLFVTDMSNGKLILQDDNIEENPDTIYNVSYTQYAMFFYRGDFGQYDATSKIGCLSVYDTITVPPYTPPVIAYVTIFKCNGQLIVILNPDSSNGVAPYQYEMINGPQTFPLQESNVFVLTEKGNYIARIIDTCNNAETYTFVVDTLTKPLITLQGSPCFGNNIALVGQQSPYFTYVWTKPNGSVYRGDSLYITPITDADTGVYNIIRINHINGCTDSTLTTYLLTGSLQTTVNATVCTNEGYTFGGHTYNSSGTYGDTLATPNCDSIVILNLNVVDHLQDSAAMTLCGGQSVTVGVHTYNQTGMYRDTFVTPYCDSIFILNLTVNALQLDSNIQTVCSGQSVSVGTHTYNTTGIYHDTLSSVVTGCDSIVISNLTFGNYTLDSVAQTICSGQHVIVGQHTYSESGIYRDTFAISGCDSLHVLNLKVDTVSAGLTATNDIICSGDSTQVCAPAGYASYQWNVAGTGDCIEVKEAGNYYVTITDGHSCTAESAPITVHTYPVSSIAIIVFGDTLSSYDAVSYQWYFNDSIIKGATAPVYIAREKGNYSLQITDTNGCTVLSEPVYVSLTGIVELPEDRVLLYPNPSSTASVRLEVGSNLIGSQLEIFDEEGRLVYQSVVGNLKSEMLTGNLPGGVYFLHIFSANKSIVRKLIRL